LIVDEVLAVGDAQFQKKCMGKMQDVATKEGRTVLFVSHSMTAIKSLTKRAILMDKGHVACDASTEEAVSKYLKLTFGSTTEGSILKSKGLHSNVTSVKLLDELGNSTASYTPGTIFSLEIYFSTDGTQNMSMELFLVDMNQTRLAIASLYQLNGVCLPSVAGNYVCKLRLEPMWLAGGSYSLDIATSQVNTAWDHQVDRIFTFTVVFSNPKSLAWDLKYSDGYGAFAWLAQDNLEIVRLSEAEVGKGAIEMACD
jgi:lipopolysaccharide transport system ATP-binding protein